MISMPVPGSVGPSSALSVLRCGASHSISPIHNVGTLARYRPVSSHICSHPSRCRASAHLCFRCFSLPLSARNTHRLLGRERKGRITQCDLCRTLQRHLHLPNTQPLSAHLATSTLQPTSAGLSFSFETWQFSTTSGVAGGAAGVPAYAATAISDSGSLSIPPLSISFSPWTFSPTAGDEAGLSRNEVTMGIPSPTTATAPAPAVTPGTGGEVPSAGGGSEPTASAPLRTAPLATTTRSAEGSPDAEDGPSYTNPTTDAAEGGPDDGAVPASTPTGTEPRTTYPIPTTGSPDVPGTEAGCCGPSFSSALPGRSDGGAARTAVVGVGGWSVETVGRYLGGAVGLALLL
ncbi:hypothetical protein BD413DRAFT_250735 [Trametes elegans]|nr:hypothetical protein BD413DRAFT_250735 [Trametes elegans]